MAVVDYDDGNYSVFNLFQQVKEEQKLRVVTPLPIVHCFETFF